MTKGIILSGGWGTRLRPLTCTIPKTLIPVVNKPVIERQILLLKKAGVKEIVLAVSVLADELKAYFKDGSDLGVKIHYTNEDNPMGTAGAIKLAEDLLKDDNFFMLNGDVILNFDLKEMLDTHKQTGGICTIASKVVNDPSRYGVILIEESTQKIEQFLEKSEYKPPGGKKVPMPINAGIYLLEPEVFSYIPPQKQVSIEKEVFPTLASENRLFNYSISGIWLDIGKPYDLLQANILLMKDLINNLKGEEENLLDASLDIKGKALFYPPVTIGANVTIGKNCNIGPNAIIGDNVHIDDDVEIKESLIYNETYISKNVKIRNTIISDNCLIQDNVVLQGNEENLVILAAHVRVLKNIRIIAPETHPLSICHHEIVSESLQ